MNFVQGRRTQYVVAACLYSACRVDKTSHMLIDFSDLLEVRLEHSNDNAVLTSHDDQINVFVLGSTYLKLVKELSLNLPSVDPSLYISRFAALLEFGDETQKVAQDAVRLVARMARDWMHIGRRPSGICGACLLLAARMNNFRRSITEVVQVVKIADVTLRKRLGEFKETASGQLTVDDFRTLWLDEVSDPPAFAKSQQREKKLRDKEQAERLERAKDVDLVAEFDVLVGVAPADVPSDAAEVPSDVAEVPSDAASDSAADEGGMAPPVISRKAMGKRKRVNQNDSGDEAMAVGDRHLKNPVVDDVITAEVEITLASTTLTLELDEAQKKKSAAAAAMTNLKLDTNDSLDDLDEAELDNFLLTPAEVAAKSRLWMEFNKDYLQALAGVFESLFFVFRFSFFVFRFFVFHFCFVRCPELLLIMSCQTSTDKETGPDGELKPMTKVKAVRCLFSLRAAQRLTRSL
jgi:transcription factor IIIB subunit 2